jgi:hypothetical protein
MSVAPIVGQGDAHRSIRTSQYTYVRNLQGPWLLFDDRQDPWQLNNLIGNPAYASLQKQLDEELQNHLRRIGDDFQPPAYYMISGDICLALTTPFHTLLKMSRCNRLWAGGRGLSLFYFGFQFRSDGWIWTVTAARDEIFCHFPRGHDTAAEIYPGSKPPKGRLEAYPVLCRPSRWFRSL